MPLLDEGDPETVIANKAYDADPLIENLEERGIVTRYDKLKSIFCATR